MGLDLRLLPFDHDGGEDFSFSHTVLSCELGGSLYEVLRHVPQLKVPAHFSTFVSSRENGDTGYGRTSKTSYGEPLLYTTIEHLFKFKDYEAVRNSRKNRAIWAYLGELPISTKVALFWH